MEKTRYIWVDYAKFISIFLVVSFHTPPELPSYWGEILRSLRMPAFFLISGFLFNPDKFSSFVNFLKHRSIQLLIPYVSFFFLFYFLWLLLGNHLGGDEDVQAKFYQPLIEFILGRPNIVIAPCWFICCLFSMQIIHFVLIKHFSRNWVLIICFLLPFMNCIIDLDLPWSIDSAMKYIPFYAFANHYKSYLSKVGKNHYKSAVILIIIYLLITFYLVRIENIWLKAFLITLSGIIILPGYIIFCKMLSGILGKLPFVEFIGKNTIVILAMQNYVIGIIKIVLFRFGGESFFDGKYVLNLIISFLVILLISIPIVIINRYFPFIIGRGKYFDKKRYEKEIGVCNQQSS